MRHQDRAGCRSSWRHRRASAEALTRHEAEEELATKRKPKDAVNERPYPEWLVGGQVERRHWDDPSVADFLRKGIPLVLTGGCPLAAKLVGKWSFDHLKEHMPASNNALTAHFAPRTVTRFNRFYGKGLGKGGVTGMPFRKFAETVDANEALEDPPWRYYMQAPMVWSEGRGKGAVPGGQMHGNPFGTVFHGDVGPSLGADLREGVDWQWLSNMCDTAETLGLHSCTMWAGCGGGCTPLHWDAMSNFFAQVLGRKRVLLFPCEQSANVYPHVQTHPMDSYAEVDVEHPDLDRYPALSRARGLETIMRPGEVLWLPGFVWHYVRQLDEGKHNLSLNFWVGAKPDGSQLVGARAKDWGYNPNISVEALVACSKASAAAAAAAAGSREKALAQEREDEALVSASTSLGLRGLVTARWLETEATVFLGGAVEKKDHAHGLKVGAFLNALADGADSEEYEQLMIRRGGGGGAEARKAARARARQYLAVMGPPGSETHTIATKLRLTMMSQVGPDATCAVMRLATRHGRLSPGLAPKIEGPVVNSEKSDQTPIPELNRIMQSGGKGIESPFL